MSTTGDFDALANSVANGDGPEAHRLTREAINRGTPVGDILERGLVRAMATVGDQFANGEIFFPELIMAGDAMRGSLQLLKPLLSRTDGAYRGKYLIGTVQGDVHDIGKSILIMMLEGNGWEVSDLGIDTPPESFCEAVANGNFDIVGIGAYLSMTLPRIQETIQALTDADLRDRLKIMVGGVPVSQTYADQVGADAYGETAVDAVRKANRLIEG